MSIQCAHNDNTWLLYNTAAISKDRLPFDQSLFSPQHLEAQQKVYRTAQGRGTTYFFNEGDFNEDGKRWVLRHYRRGGLVGKLMHDDYIWLSLLRTRPYQELHLLQTIAALGLPAPQPVATRITRRGYYYKGDIITTAIDDSQSLVHVLKQGPLAEQHWQIIGHTIARFHQHGIYHDDLNAHNILLNREMAVFLIDFDKGMQRATHVRWQQHNLQRLLRSLNKEQKLGRIACFTPTHWQALISGYSTTMQNEELQR